MIGKEVEGLSEEENNEEDNPNHDALSSDKEGFSQFCRRMAK